MVDNEESRGDIAQMVGSIAGLLFRRRWILITTAWAVVLGTNALLLHLPDRYTSEATLFVVRQQVPERYVTPTTTSDISQALGAIAQETLSRPKLLSIINELNLYPTQKAKLAPDDLTKLARRDVSIEPLSDRPNAFKISFVAENPLIARAVTSRLTTLFIEQNLKTRADQATTTTRFLREQLEAAKVQLDQKEQSLREFKMQFLGELPEQQQGNLGILAGLQTQLDNIQGTRNQAQQQRLYLESLLGEYRRLRQRSGGGIASYNGQVITPYDTAQIELLRLKALQAKVLNSYTAQHPDVTKVKREIEAQEEFAASLKRAQDVPADAVQLAELTGSTEEGTAAAQLKSQLEANTLEIQNLTKREAQLHSQIEVYQNRLNVTPVREQQLTSLQRDYDLLRQYYGDLLRKEQESQLSTSLEKSQEGQQFRLAEPPNLPAKPSSPKRMKFSLMALGAGLVLGCSFAFLKDLKHPSFHAESDAATRLAVPFVVGIPLILTPAELRARFQRIIFECFAGSGLALMLLVAEIHVYRRG